MAVLPVPEPLLQHHLQTLTPLLNNWLRTKQYPSALVLLGMDGVGKRTLGHYLAQWFFCEQKAGERPCGTCSNCHKALSGNWLDFTEVLVLNDDGLPVSIKLEHVEQLRPSLGRSAFEASHRVVLINHADLMNLTTANSLLKILEEPPPQVIFILTAATRSTLLPTLLSRCQPLILRPATEESLRVILQSGERELSKEKIDFAVGLAQGSLGRALRFTSEHAWEAQQKVDAFVASPQKEFSTLTEWASGQSNRAALTLDLLENYSSKNLIADPRSALRIERIHRARSELLTPVNKKILFQDVLSGYL